MVRSWIMRQKIYLLVWWWNSNQEYSAKSFYEMMLSGGKTVCKFEFIWKLKMPPTVRVFAFLCLHDKLLTHETMARSGFHCELNCVLCQSCPLETAIHLFFYCRFAKRFWQRLLWISGFNLVQNGVSIQHMLDNFRKECRSAEVARTLRKSRLSFFLKY